MMSDKLLLYFADKVNEVYNQFKKDKDTFAKIPDGETKLISAPRLVLVGTQSSGKSSLVNRMIGFELIPIGENMVTRTPINIRLHFTESAIIPVLALSLFKDGALTELFKTSLNQETRLQKLEQFRNKISSYTDQITKNKWSISNTPIFIDICSNKVTDFSFIDLPGQVAIACTDKGQSEKLIEEIEELIKEQVSIPNTVVLTVVQSKTDLETDIGLALIKKMQNKYKTFSTVGVITKPDLLDNLDNLNNIVGGNISKNVMMDGGYFVVNNKTESTQKETEYFMQNFDQKREVIANKRYGILNLTTHLQKYLITSIKKNLPDIKRDLSDMLKSQKARSSMMGNELKDSQSKINYFSRVTYQIDSTIMNYLESNGSNPNVGSKIGKIIDEFVNSIIQLNPFSTDEVNDSYLNEIIESFNGYHLTTQVSIEQLIDRCITDKNKKPIMLILPISTKCVNSIISILGGTIGHIIKSNTITGLEMYPKLKALIINTLISNVQSYGDSVIASIVYYLEKEEEFVWSTSPEFKSALSSSYLPRSNNDPQKQSKDNIQSSMTTHYSYNPDQVRTLSTEYFKTVKTRAVDYIVKLIISGTIKKLERNVSSDLNQMLITQPSQTISELFSEDPNIVKERTTILNNITKLEEIITIANTCDIQM